MQVSNNGLISFGSSLTIISHRPISLPIPNNSFVAPFWADIDTRGNGSVWIRETRNTTILNRTREDIQKAFSTPINFQPQFALIATWDEVGYFSRQFDRVSTNNKPWYFSVRCQPMVTILLASCCNWLPDHNNHTVVRWLRTTLNINNIHGIKLVAMELCVGANLAHSVICPGMHQVF